MKNDNEIIDSLIKGGLIGTTMGALLSKNKEEGVLLGALASAAIIATFKASEEAKKTNVLMYVEEDGFLFQIAPGGIKKRIRQIEKPSIKLQQRFKLK